MIERRVRIVIGQACGYLALGLGRQAQEVLARNLDPDDHDSIPILMLRMRALVVAKEWKQGIEFGHLLIATLRGNQFDAGPVGAHILYDLSTCYHSVGDAKNGRECAAAAEKAVKPTYSFANERFEALWDVIADSLRDEVGFNCGWPSDPPKNHAKGQ